MQCIDHYPMILGESPLWDHREDTLYWIDIEAMDLHALQIESRKRRAWTLPSKPGSIALHQEGGLLIALSKEIVHFFPDSGKFESLKGTQIEGTVRFNDGKCDSKGRFWVGSMDLQEKDPIGILYCLEGKKMFQKEQGIIISNGLDWSPDQTVMYFTDSPRKIIYRYDFNLNRGEISNRRIFVKLPDDVGFPDGLCVDQDGYIWSAHFMGGLITRYAPNGDIDREVQVPALCPTSCCIGGKKRNQLFVTTATRDLTAEQKNQNSHNGCIFMLDLDVTSKEQTPYFP